MSYQPLSLRYVGDDAAIVHAVTRSTHAGGRTGEGERRVHNSSVLGSWLHYVVSGCARRPIKLRYGRAHRYGAGRLFRRDHYPLEVMLSIVISLCGSAGAFHVQRVAAHRSTYSAGVK